MKFIVGMGFTILNHGKMWYNKRQISEVEKSYDRDEDNIVELFCRRFGWTVFETDDIPDFTYDRDTEMLFKSK